MSKSHTKAVNASRDLFRGRRKMSLSSREAFSGIRTSSQAKSRSRAAFFKS